MADVEKPLDLPLARRGGGHEMLREQARHELQALDPSADAQQPPALIVRHVLGGVAAERGQ